MIQSLLLIAIVIAIVYLVKYTGRLSPDKRKKFLIKYGLYLIAIVAIGLMVTGKLHWVAAAVAALLPLSQKLIFLALKAMPFLNYWKEKKQSDDKTKQSSSSYAGTMTTQQALEILGLEEVDNLEQITKRHKELMQKNHPDRGGSDFLAAQINQAKDTLVKNLKS